MSFVESAILLKGINKMQFVIWGNGKLGKVAVEVLKNYKIACIVERNKSLQGSFYNDIPVISPDNFLQSKYKAFPVLVTPIDYENEIIKWLYDHGVYCCFTYSESSNQIRAYTMQLSKKFVSSLVTDFEEVCISEINLLSLLLANDLSLMGKKIVFLLNRKSYDYYKSRIPSFIQPNVICIDEYKGIGSVLLRTGRYSDYLNTYINRLNLKVFDFYHISSNRNLFRNQELERFKNVHKGKRCFVIGNGPSLRIDDLDKLHENAEICFAVNAIFKVFEKTSWRPDYYCENDQVGFVYWKENILRVPAKVIFIGDISGYSVKRDGNIFGYHVFLVDDDETFFSDDVVCGTCVGNTVIYDACLQFAAYMGFSEIYLLGCDCSFGKDGSHHFVKDYESKSGKTTTREANFLKMIHSYEVAKSYAETHGISIYNATRGGKLEVFPRVDFDSLFDKKQ